MSAKWRALQHRHRYTYSAVVFPSSFTDTLLSQSLLPSDPNVSLFFIHLKTLISLNSIYSQVNHAKNLVSSFTNLLSLKHTENDTPALQTACRLYVEVLFLENSVPLHRTLISGLSKVSNKDCQVLIVESFTDLCKEYKKWSDRKRFCLSRVALSIMGMPKLGFLISVVGDCAVLIGWDVVLGLNSVVSEIEDLGGRPSPVVMEQCQESLSCLYYLIQRFPGTFKCFEEVGFMERVLGVLISVLKSIAFTRDCFVAAGVALCAALQVCLTGEELGLIIFKVIFNGITSSSSGTNCFESECRDVVLKVPFKGDLCFEINGFSVLSRLCLIRGILTAVSRAVLNSQFVVSSGGWNGNEENGNCCGSVKTILYDGILLELCNYCENPIDSHFNFHVLTVLQICLQQIKTSMLSKLTDISNNYEPIPEEMGTRILKIIWNSLGDPLSQTVKQVHLIFDLFLDIQSSLHCGEGSERIKSFLQKITSDLLRLGSGIKGRYVPLALMTKRLGAKTIMDMSPDLLFDTVQAYVDDDVCCATTAFLKCFLECLRDECWNCNGIEEGYTVYRQHCLPPFLHGLASGISKLRSNLNSYALPVLLEVDVDSIFHMLAYISVGLIGEENVLSYHELSCTNVELGVEQQVAILVSLVKVCRSLALIEGDIDLWDASEPLQTNVMLRTDSVNLYALFSIKGIKVKVHVEWLVLALRHADELLRVDAAESLFLNPKTSSIPSYLELTLLKETVPLNMRSCSTGFQMKWTSLFRKFFARVRTALERQLKQGSWQPFMDCNNSGAYSDNGTEEYVIKRAENLFSFMRWLSCFLFFSCYPSAPYKRKIMAMDLLLIMLNVWSITLTSQDKDGSLSPESSLYPYSKGITLPDSTLLLVGSIIDSWDRLRESSFRILLYFPTPLPGISSKDMVQKVINWAKKLVCSTRVRESDAGALTLRLLFRKYVLEQGWILRASADAVCFQSQSELVNVDSQIIESKPPVVEYIKSLIEWLNTSVEEGEGNLYEACKNSFVHGVLLTLRYTFEELDWNSDAVLSSISEMRRALEKLLELLVRITSLALWVVSADAWYLADMDEMADDDVYLMDEMEVVRPSEDEGNSSKHVQVQDSRPSEQIVMVGCWLAMKEVSLLLGTIIRKIPLPGYSYSDSKAEDPCPDASMLIIPNAMLDLQQLEQIGNHFLEVLLKMKHNGAIDKTRVGFTALCNRLLCSNDLRLCKLPEIWMEQLMERTIAKGQVVDDLLRRSAGIPAAFIALFLSEPDGAPKKLLPRALRWLIDVANSSLIYLVDAKSMNGNSCELSSTNPDQEPDSAKLYGVNVMEKTSKIRDEGVIPTVHAFNVLRAAFNDTNLGTDTSGFAAEALIVSIRSFSSPYWEVRNSACLAYTALVRRMIGFLNLQKRESVRRALTGLEFFHRYPSLHPFLYNELNVATDALGDATSGCSESNLSKVVHPSLCPVLILLSRLKPSTIASERGDGLDPFIFMPFIRRCSTQSNLRVRVLASRALTGLVSNEKLPTVLLNIGFELPCMESQIPASSFPSSLLNPSNGTACTNYNSIHGMLLQLCSLLDANCRNLADFTKKEKILGDLFQVLVKRSWIASPKMCPCPILNCSFIRVLDHMLSIAQTGHVSENFFPIRSLLWKVCTECLDVADSFGVSYYDPTVAELRGQAIISYFSCVLQTSKDGMEEVLQKTQAHLLLDLKLLNLPGTKETFVAVEERLVSSLSDSSYEVRLATLKWLLKFLKSAESFSDVHQSSSAIGIIQRWSKRNLQETMVKLLDSEKYNRCKYYILRILFTWNLQQFQKLGNQNSADITYVGNLDDDSMSQFWGKLLSLYNITRHKKSREALICCMALCVKKFSSLLTSSVLSYMEEKTSKSCESCQLERSAHLYESITHFVNLIKEHSSSSEPVSKRNAAAESIIASGLLEQAELIGSCVLSNEIPAGLSGSCFEPKEAVNMYGHQLLKIWFTCIMLLEDEDDGIRQWLALNVQKCFSSKASGRSFHAAGVPMQVEKVIELSFGYLSSIFGHWIDYFDHLLQWVINVANYVTSKGDIVRQVFDKEIDNHHEEKLLICQICCSHLEQLPISKSWLADGPIKQKFTNYLFNWRKRFCNQLTYFAKDHIENLGGVDWIVGAGNHKDAFLPIYANLLGFYALSNCMINGNIEDSMLLLTEVDEIGKTIDPFLRNPLISNLYLLVVNLHERKVGATAGMLACKFIDDSIWDGFDPYFLL
ncbi:THYROID ADENOMA-ASSOCIATED PROTEIN-like protein, partial [Salix koriyanagi]